ncbi:MAG: PAS domain S-box protein [Balneolaceae bacterium]|nr:PAS domain S-box protein [Balneolaceae bacterium]
MSWNHLIKKNPLATIKWDENRRVTEWSAGAEKISGYTKEEMLGKSMLELNLFTDDVRSYLEKRIEQFQKQRSIEGLETQIKAKDGNTVDIRIHTSVLRDDSGNAQTLLTLVEDITETKQAERRLSRQNEIIRFINDLSTSVGSIQNFDKALEQSIEKICKFIGWPVGHVYKRTNNDRFVSSDIWYFEKSQQYDFFVESCNTTKYVPGKGFLGEVIEHGAPTSLKNIGEKEEFIRESSDSKADLKTCFALPIKVGNETTVILEFLSEEVVQPDTFFPGYAGFS